MSDQEIEISPLEVYAMVVARDALMEQLLTLFGGAELASMWDQATMEIDQQIRNGLVSNVQEVDTDGEIPPR